MWKVAVVVQPNAEHFGIGVATEVWAERHHPDDDNPVFDFSVCAVEPGVVRGESGLDLSVRHGLEALEGADLVCVTSRRDYQENDPRLIEALQAAHAAGATISGFCTAVFQIGATGLLDGRRCTTHWRYGPELQATYPHTTVDTDVLYVDEGSVVTGAGSAGGIDANLHLLRRSFGSQVAAAAARRIVVPPHRDGGQAQYVRAPMPVLSADSLSPVLEWIQQHLGEPLTVADMAAQAFLSERTFARRFRTETGTTPWQWLLGRRLALAEELLETSHLSIAEIAERAGFGNAATLRQHFGAARGTSPAAYRRAFGCLRETQPVR